MGLKFFIKETPERFLVLFLPYEEARKRWQSLTWKRNFKRTQLCRCLDHGHSASRTMRSSFVVFKIPSLWYFVIAPQTHRGKKEAFLIIKVRYFSFHEWESNERKSYSTWFILNITCNYIVHIIFPCQTS